MRPMIIVKVISPIAGNHSFMNSDRSASTAGSLGATHEGICSAMPWATAASDCT